MKGYEKLDDVLSRAYKQASEGKGKERHATLAPFHEQPMQQVNGMVGVGFSNGQAIKKIIESQNMAPEKAVHELLGAICYLAGSIITIEAEPVQGVSYSNDETFEYLDPKTWKLHTVTADQGISCDWIKVPEGADALAGDAKSESCRYFWNHQKNKIIGTGESLERYPEWDDCEGNTAQNWVNAVGQPDFKILWSRNTLPLTRDQAREILANMRRGSVANINDHGIEFTEHGCFDVKRGNHGGHFSQSLKQTLNYIFQDSK